MNSRLDKIIFNLANSNVRVNNDKVIISSEIIQNWDETGLFHKQTMNQISGTEFADMMFKLLDSSNENFSKFQDASVRVQVMDMVEEYYKNESLLLEKVTKAVETMYKRPKKREEYITKTMEAQKRTFFNTLPINYSKKEIKYFSLDTSFGVKEHSEEITLHKDRDVLRDRFFAIWNTIKDNEILNEVMGIQFVYTPLDEYGLQVSFPTVEFILTDKGEKEYKKNKIKIELN